MQPGQLQLVSPNACAGMSSRTSGMQMALRWTVGTLLLASVGGQFVPTSGPCAGKDLATNDVHNLLAGAHLKVLETPWSPYAIKDETMPYGWTGFDIDLFQAVADKLGFTFEIGEEPMLDGEAARRALEAASTPPPVWTDRASRADGDVSWVGVGPRRCERVASLSGPRAVTRMHVTSRPSPIST